MKGMGSESASGGAMEKGLMSSSFEGFQRSFALPKQRLHAQEFATLSIGAHLAQLPHASLARHPFLSPIKKRLVRACETA